MTPDADGQREPAVSTARACGLLVAVVAGCIACVGESSGEVQDAGTTDQPRQQDHMLLADVAGSDQGDGAVVRGCPPGSGEGPLGGSRPTALKIPASYNPALKYPLVIELHGRGANGQAAEDLFGMGKLADANGIFVMAPDGTLDAPPPPTEPASFWNATDGCCNLYGSTVDDVAYLRSLICHTQANYSIDPQRVYIIGASNGGFMAHRMACDAADLVTAIISIAGLVWNDPARCQPTRPVSMLQIHGTADTVVPVNGTAELVPGPAPSAQATYETWAQLNGCTGDNVTGPVIDFDQSVSGQETVTVFKPASESCRVRTELWMVVGGGHVPSMSSSTRQFFVTWFMATPIDS